MLAKMKKPLAALLTIVMFVGLLPTGVLAATTSETQIEGTSTPRYYTYDAANGTFGNPSSNPVTAYDSGEKVKVSKTISGTGSENEFDITLKVETKQAITKSEKSPDAAAVLVIDTSGSMKGNRLAAAKKAAIEFAHSFAKSANGAKRQLAVVTFAAGAYYQYGWQDIATLTWADTAATSNNALTRTINGISAVGGTNMEAALLVTKNVLSKTAVSKIDHRYVVFLTDGAPTYRMDNGFASKFTGTTIDVIDNGYNIVGGANQNDVSGDGSSATKANADAAAAVAAQIRNMAASTTAKQKVELLSVAFGAKDTPIWGYNAYYDEWVQWKTVSQWLTDISTKAPYSADDADELLGAFESIVQQIEMMTNAWQVADPMGEKIEFVSGTGVVNDGNNQEKIFDTANKKLVWDLTKATPKNSGDVHTYEMTYRVRLNNLGAAKDVYYLTNGETTLTYNYTKTETVNGNQVTYVTDDQGHRVFDATTGKVIKGMEKWAENQVAEFKVPKVKSLFVDLAFTKVGHETVNAKHPALAGVTFKVQHSSDCACGQTGTYTNTAISNKDGAVSFANLPSGHTYVLTETNAPANYDAMAAYTVAASFGNAALKNAQNQAVTNGIIENTLNPKNTVYTVNKNWNDNKNAYGTRQNVTFTLMRVVGAKDDAQNKETNDVEAQSLTLTAANKTSATQWSGSFEAVPTVDIETGAQLSYYVKEVAIDGYTTQVGSLSGKTFTVTNTLTADRTITIRKDWVADAKLMDQISSVTVLLKQNNILYNGEGVKNGVVTLTKANGWQATIENVPVYNSTNQARYDYTVEEQGVTSGSVTLGGKAFTVSATSGTGSVSDPFVIKNTIAAGSVTINGTKEWKDDSNAYNTRPDSITVSLLADGRETGHSVTLAKDAASNAQSYAFPSDDTYTLPEYDVTNGHKIVYTVAEEGVAAPYQTAIDGYTITNKLVGTVSVAGEKTWQVDDETKQIPAEVTVELLQNGSSIAEKTIGKDGDWSYSFTGLNEYDANGVKYSYSVQEKGEKNGSVTIGNITYAVSHDGSDIKNTVTDTTTIQGTKIWVDGNNALNTRPEASAVKIGLYNGSTLVTSTNLTVDDAGAYHYQFNDVPVYDGAGKKIDYTVREMSGDNAISNHGEIAFANGNYVVTYGENTITNTIKQETITVYGKKVWVDGNNAQNTRPDSITINLSGGASKQIAKAAAAEQEFSFTGLNKFDAAGAVINYTVSENTVTGYNTAAITGSGTESDPFVITNTYAIPTTKLAVSKTWIDGNRDHSGDNVVLQLVRNGNEEVSGKTLTLNAANSWGKDAAAPVEFTDLPLYSADYQTAYSYSVKETNKPAGYDASVNNGNVTNTLIDSKDVSINVQKVWIGPENARPESVIFNLYRASNGGEAQFVQEITVTPDKDGVWSGKADGLSRIDSNGYEYQYSVTEKGAETGKDGKTTATYNGVTYDVAVSNFTITNKVQQSNDVKVEGEKIWANYTGNLPTGVVIDLYADGHLVGGEQSRTLPAQAAAEATPDWHYTFENLPKYDLSASGDGHEIVYSVKERGVSEAGTILFGNDHFNVAGGTKADGYKITNTYTSTDVYQYRVEAHYTIILDGKAQPTEDVNIGSFTTEKGTTITKTGSEYVLHNSKTYTFDESNKNNVLSVKVDDPNTTPTLVLNYVLVATTPEPPTPPTPDADSYSLIIHYKEKDTGITLAGDVTRFVTEGGSYDVTALTQNEITGYTLDSVTGGKTADSNVYRNVEITVWYVAEEVIDPTKPPLTPDPGKPETPVTPTNPGEEVIEPTNPPLTPNPGELIPDENVPLSGLPHTGGAESIRGLLAVLMSTGTLGLAAGLRRKKDNDSEEDK